MLLPQESRYPDDSVFLVAKAAAAANPVYDRQQHDGEDADVEGGLMFDPVGAGSNPTDVSGFPFLFDSDMALDVMMTVPGIEVFSSPPDPLVDASLYSIGTLLASLPSLVPLTVSDHQALEFYSGEDAFGFGNKHPAWSTHAILMRTARRDPTVLHCLLAASARELAWRVDGRGQGDGAAGLFSCEMSNSAESHHRIGRQLLASAVAEPASSDPLAVMASFWFLYLYHRRQPGKARACGELSGMMADYIATHQLHHVALLLPPQEDLTTRETAIELARSPDKRALLARLTVWLFWCDAQLCSQGQGGSMARLLIQSSASSPKILRDLYKVSKDTLSLNWTNYPGDEVVDDIKNSSALKFLHQTWILVQELNEATKELLPLKDDTSREIKTKIEDLRRKHSAVFRLVESTRSERTHDLRLLGNSEWAVANYYALLIYHFRCTIGALKETGDLDTGGNHSGNEDGNGVEHAVSALLMICQNSIEEATAWKGQLDRLQWALFWVGVEMRTDEFKQRWILFRLTNEALRSALQQVIAEQSALGGSRIGMKRIRHIFQAVGTNDGQGAEGVVWPA